jgi:hypothetical protein
MAGNDKLPSGKELDALVNVPFDGECTVLCHSLLDAIDDFDKATGIEKLRLKALIRAIRARMAAIPCHGECLPA